MKYLKLINTEECLKLAECLIGSECYTDKGILDLSTGGYALDGVHYCVESCEWDKNEFLLFDETHRNFSKHILIPLEAIKLNPFKAMEHQVRVLVENKYFEEGHRDRIKDGRIKSIGEKPSPKNENEFEVAVSIEQLPFKMIDEKNAQKAVAGVSLVVYFVNPGSWKTPKYRYVTFEQLKCYQKGTVVYTLFCGKYPAKNKKFLLAGFKEWPEIGLCVVGTHVVTGENVTVKSRNNFVVEV